MSDWGVALLMAPIVAMAIVMWLGLALVAVSALMKWIGYR